MQTPEIPMRITEQEILLIQQTFRGNERMLRLLRKVFIPELREGVENEVPLGQLVDLWMDRDYSTMEPAAAQRMVVARQEAIKFLESGLLQLSFLANKPIESPDILEKRRNQNSAK